ncbi:MAG: sodium:solute symporter family protein [Planctomycetes bacterium]|nr:sodium:solute symporter family protein [Planctomycetota bacterium]
MSWVFAGVLAYLLVQFAIGVFVSRKVASQSDYYLAGRRLGPVLAGSSMFATWFGAESCVGAAGHVYESGFDRMTVEPFAYGACLLLLGVFFAIPLWKSGATTLADLFAQRYSGSVSRIAAVLLIPTSILWAAAQIRAFGQVLASASTLSVEWGMGIAALIVILYTGVGGLLADVVTDFVQAICLLVGLAVVLFGVCTTVGGADRAWELAWVPRTAPSAAASWTEVLEAWAIPICGSVVAQEAVSRSLACRAPSVARGAALSGGILYLFAGSIPVFLGLVGAHAIPGLDSGQILPRLAQEHLGTFGFILFSGALISAILSTVDSTLLVSSSLIARNLLFTSGEPSDAKKGLLVARAGVVGSGAAAWGLAHYSEGVSDLVEQASGFGSAGILVLVAFGLFSQFGGPLAALASLTVGSALWGWGRYFGGETSHPYLWSLAGAFGAFVLAGLLERRQPRAVGT